MIASGTGNFAIDSTTAGAFATNGFAEFSPGGYSMAAAFITEVFFNCRIFNHYYGSNTP